MEISSFALSRGFGANCLSGLETVDHGFAMQTDDVGSRWPRRQSFAIANGMKSLFGTESRIASAAFRKSSIAGLTPFLLKVVILIEPGFGSIHFVGCKK